MSTESDLIQRQRELLRQARVANRTRTDAEARATAQHGQAQQQAEKTLAAATQQAETAQRQAQAQADADLRKATANAQSVLEQTQNQVAQRRATAADGETQAQELLEQVALGEPYRPVHAQPAPVEPDSRAALQKAADQVAAPLRDIQEAVEDLGQQRAEARAKRKALLWWVAAGLLGVAPFWFWQQGIGEPSCFFIIFIALSLFATIAGRRSWNRPRKLIAMKKEASANRAALRPRILAASGFVNAVDGALYVHVPAGPFSMGSTDRADEQPVHTVTLNEYWIMQTPVTNAMYAKCVAAGACTAPRNSDWQEILYADNPVTNVSWNQIAAYCAWAGARLPTEAEWEKAARGTDGRKYPWGNEPPTMELCNFNRNVGDTTPVGSYPKGASPYGALDMAGNVWEQVNDWYDEKYYSVSPGSNPQGPATWSFRVHRGGSWLSDDNVRSAIRFWGHFSPEFYRPVFGSNFAGFRCVRSQ